MGKKSGRRGGEAEPTAAAFLLRVPMHCRCNGCSDKIRAGVKDLTLHHGILQLDQSALATKGELKVLLAAGAADDPDKLRRRLRKTTGKNVDLVPLKQPQPANAHAHAHANAAADKELLEAMLLRGGLQQAAAAQYGGHGQGAWPAQVLPGYAYGSAAAAQAYPWVLQQQQQQAETYQGPVAYHAAAYPAAYAYPQGLGGAYGGGWPGHGGY